MLRRRRNTSAKNVVIAVMEKIASNGGLHLRRRFAGSLRKRDFFARNVRQCQIVMEGNDVEVGARPSRRLSEEALQGTAPEEDGECFLDVESQESHEAHKKLKRKKKSKRYDDEDGHVTQEQSHDSKDLLEWLRDSCQWMEHPHIDKCDACKLALRGKSTVCSPCRPAKDMKRHERERHVIQIIRQATTTSCMFCRMDTLIEPKWLKDVSPEPGNIYRIAVFKSSELLDWQNFGFATCGFCFIFLIQLIGPVAIFFQLLQKIDWNKMGTPTADWSATKLVADLFVFLICYNGFYWQRKEADSWIDIDETFRWLACQRNYKKMQPDTEHSEQGETADVRAELGTAPELFLKLGAFMNCWVLFWLNLDVFLVLSLSESVLEVLMDALGLTFLYNLDDVGGDLAFVQEDDWPGVQLAWLHQKIQEAREEAAEPKKLRGIRDPVQNPIEVLEASRSCQYLLIFTRAVLGFMVFVLPVLFLFMPLEGM